MASEARTEHHRVVYTSNGYVLDESPERLGRLEAVPDSELRDRAALWRRLKRDGYLFLRGFLDREQVLAFRAFYFDAMRATGLVEPDADPALGLAGVEDYDRQAFRRALFDVITPSPEYRGLVSSPRIESWFRWLFDDEPRLHNRRILRHTRPGERGIGTSTQAHYDLIYLREGTDRVLSMWIPLGDCPTWRGGLTYLERSHRRVLEQERAGLLPQPVKSITADLPALAERHDERWLIADYLAGDVVVHSAHTVHAALDNVDPDGIMRLSTDIRYQRTSEPIDWRWDYDQSYAEILDAFQLLQDPAERDRVRRAIQERLDHRTGLAASDDHGSHFGDLLDLIADPAERQRVIAILPSIYGDAAPDPASD